MSAEARPPWPGTQEAEILMEPLIAWLRSSQRLRAEGGIFFEVPWAGRRVDVVTLGKRLRTSAFELKLGRTGRVLEQAIYNRAAFDRSYIVVSHLPSRPHLDEAHRQGIGILLVTANEARLVIDSPLRRPRHPVRDRLLSSLRRRTPWDHLR